jgi:hypothetical protein
VVAGQVAVLRVRRENLDTPPSKVSITLTVYPVHRVIPDLLVIQVPPELRVWRGLQELLVQRVTRAIQVIWDRRDFRVHRGYKDHLEHKELKAILVIPAHKVFKVNKVQREGLGTP